MPNATKSDYQTAFAGLDFPTSKAAVLNRARDNGGIDREVAAILSELPDRSFETLDDLKHEVRAIYKAWGEPEDSLPV